MPATTVMNTNGSTTITTAVLMTKAQQQERKEEDREGQDEDREQHAEEDPERQRQQIAARVPSLRVDWSLGSRLRAIRRQPALLTTYERRLREVLGNGAGRPGRAAPTAGGRPSADG
mgnify:CR=1 FL=1